jgi:regulator of protease activity HflC (stomatin/prohibitin superfamily)
LIVAPGNAVVLENGGRITRILGPGFYKLVRFETFHKPVKTKGIVDLRPQGRSGVAEDVRTKDGISLDIQIATFFQLEPTYETDRRPESHFANGDATTKVIGAPELPVYEAIIRKSLFNVPAGGWMDNWFPGDPITRLRDVVATYTLDEIFAFDRQEEQFTPDQRVIQEIEAKVVEMYNPVNAGVWFKGCDIREIKMPEEVEERVRQRWTARVERELKIAEAEAERDAMLHWSEGRARALAQIEEVKLRARTRMAQMIGEMVDGLTRIDQESVAMSFVNVVQELTNRVGQDETVAMRYIDAMQAIVRSDGVKSFVITPPNPNLPSGHLPSPPTPGAKTRNEIEQQRLHDQEGD